MTKILGISGALRKASTNTGLLRALKEMAPAHVSFDIATLHGIPLFDEDDEAATGKPEAVKALDARIRAAASQPLSRSSLITPPPRTDRPASGRRPASRR